MLLVLNVAFTYFFLHELPFLNETVLTWAGKPPLFASWHYWPSLQSARPWWSVLMRPVVLPVLAKQSSCSCLLLHMASLTPDTLRLPLSCHRWTHLYKWWKESMNRWRFPSALAKLIFRKEGTQKHVNEKGSSITHLEESAIQPPSYAWAHGHQWLVALTNTREYASLHAWAHRPRIAVANSGLVISKWQARHNVFIIGQVPCHWCVEAGRTSYWTSSLRTLNGTKLIRISGVDRQFRANYSLFV